MIEPLSRTSALASRHRVLGVTMLAHLKPNSAKPGTELTLSGDDMDTQAVVVSTPIYDPDKLRTHAL